MSRIVLIGATGYTGSLTARALVAAGVRPTLAGRSQRRLGELAAELGGIDTAHADVHDRDSLSRLIREDDVVISTVGPFQTLGRPVIETVVDRGAIYLDSTGESAFIRSVFERYNALGARTGARLITAFGCDWVPGNLAGGLAIAESAAKGGRPVHEVQVGYFLTGATRTSLSRGTATTMFQSGLEPSYRFHRRRISPDRTAARMRSFELHGRVGEDLDQRMSRAVSIGGSEQFTLPRLAETLSEVDVYLGWFGGASSVAHLASPVVDALSRVPGAAGLWSKLGDRLTANLPDGPGPDASAGVRNQVIAEAFDSYGTLLSRVRLDGPEPYGMTAGLLAWGAIRAAQHGVAGTGALGPVDAFGLDELRAGAASAGLVVVDER